MIFVPSLGTSLVRREGGSTLLVPLATRGSGDEHLGDELVGTDFVFVCLESVFNKGIPNRLAMDRDVMTSPQSVGPYFERDRSSTRATRAGVSAGATAHAADEDSELMDGDVITREWVIRCEHAR